jgi:adenosylcobinamide-phosphate synthase
MSREIRSAMHLSATFPVTLAALTLDTVIGYPQALYRNIGHPVTWMGAYLARLDDSLNRPAAAFRDRRLAGIFALILFLAAIGAFTLFIEGVLKGELAGYITVAVLASSLIAQRSLAEHVGDVADALGAGDLPGGRMAVARIVGRNPALLDRSGVARAAIESLAENFSDGVVAPTFWLCIGGLTGGALYKATNTADSMIGHKNERFAAFGWAAARFDDLVNLPASRLAALWLIFAACVLPLASPRAAIGAVFRDAHRHRSPNAGWPEAAMAGALGLKLAGPRVYGDEIVDDAFMGEGRREATSADIRQALRLYRRACVIQWLVLGGLTLTLILRG